MLQSQVIPGQEGLLFIPQELWSAICSQMKRLALFSGPFTSCSTPCPTCMPREKGALIYKRQSSRLHAAGVTAASFQDDSRAWLPPHCSPHRNGSFPSSRGKGAKAIPSVWRLTSPQLVHWIEKQTANFSLLIFIGKYLLRRRFRVVSHTVRIFFFTWTTHCWSRQMSFTTLGACLIYTLISKATGHPW